MDNTGKGGWRWKPWQPPQNTEHMMQHPALTAHLPMGNTEVVLLCPMLEMWQWWGKPWPLVKAASSEIMWPLLSRIMYSCERLLQHCSTAGQAAAGHLGLTWLQPDCRSSCRTITAVIQICNYNQNCSTTGVLQLHCTVQLTYWVILQLHSNCHSKSQHDCQTIDITTRFLENILFAEEE